MRIPKPFLILLLALVLSFLVAVPVHAQGSSFDSAEDLTGTSGKSHVYISSGSHWYKYNVDSRDVVVTICVSPDDTLDVDLFVYNSSGALLGDSIRGTGETDCVDVPGRVYTGYVYIEVRQIAGSGYYDLAISTSGSSGSSSGGSSGGSSSSSGSSDECPCEGVPFPCHCNVFGWDPCYSLAQVYCAIAGFGNMIQQFFQNVVHFFQNIANAITGFFASLGQAIMNGINAVVGFFQSLAQSVVNFFSGIGSAIARGAQAIGSGIANAITAVIQGIASFFRSLFRGIQQAFQGLGQALGGAGDWLGNNWLLIIGLVLLVIGLFVNGALTIVGAIILMAYALSTGQINWGILLVAIGCVILGFALRR